MLFVVVIAGIDYSSGYEISWSVFLGFSDCAHDLVCRSPCGVWALVVERSPWIVGEFASGLAVSTWLVLVWNSAIRLAFYYVFIGLLSHIRELTNNLEERVFERTADLRREIMERERLERELLEIGERERRRVGYDLHDGLGPHLTAISLAVQVLGKKLFRRGVPEAEEATKAVALIEEGIALSHKLAKGLQPVEMHAGGLMRLIPPNPRKRLFAL